MISGERLGGLHQTPRDAIGAGCRADYRDVDFSTLGHVSVHLQGACAAQLHHRVLLLLGHFLPSDIPRSTALSFIFVPIVQHSGSSSPAFFRSLRIVSTCRHLAWVDAPPV